MPAEFATTSVEIADDVTPTLATSAHQATQNTKLDTLHTDNVALQALVDGVEGLLTTLAGKDFATQTTLAALLAKVIAAPSTEAKQDAANTLLTAIAASVDQLEGYTDGIEALLGTGNTSLTSILSAAGATGDASSASTLVGLLKAIKASVAGTLLVERSTVAAASAPATAAVTSASAEAVATNPSRRGLNVENVGSVDVALGLGAAAVDNSGIVLKASGGSWDGLISGILFTGQIRAKTAAGTSTLAVQEV